MKEKCKIISVIIPVFNTEKYIEKMLSYVLNQTLKDIEFIFIDDGSTDASLNMLKIAAGTDKRIRIIEQTNQKQGAARNRGIEIAKGEYLGFVDSDDWIDLDYFEKLYTAAKTHDADIALATNIRIGKNKYKPRLEITQERAYISTEDKYKICKQWREGCPTNKIYRKQFLDKHNIRFPEDTYYEDILFTAKAVHFANKLVTVPGVNYYYFENQDSTVKSPKFKKQKMNDKINARKEILRFVRENNIQFKDWLFVAEKKKVEFLGIPLITVKESTETERVFLFGILQIWVKNLTKCAKQAL